MTGYVKLRHPYRIGETILAVPTGKTRTTERGGTEAEGKVCSPGANLETVWFTKQDLVDKPQDKG